MSGHFDGKTGDALAGDSPLESRERTSRQVDPHPGSCFVHRKFEAETRDSALVVESSAKRFADCEAHILDGVVSIDTEITCRCHIQREPAMSCDLVKHVIEKLDAGRNAHRSILIQIDADRDIGLLGGSPRGGASPRRRP